MDVTTRYLEALPLKAIDTEAVAEAVMGIFGHTGILDEVLSDGGTQFTLALMKAVMRLYQRPSYTVHRITHKPMDRLSDLMVH